MNRRTYLWMAVFGLTVLVANASTIWAQEALEVAVTRSDDIGPDGLKHRGDRSIDDSQPGVDSHNEPGDDHADRSDREDRSGRSDRADRPERAERADRPERAERADRPERAERAERPDRADRSDR